MGHVMPTLSGTFEDSHNYVTMPTVAPFVAPWQYEESLLIRKAHMLPYIISKNLSSYS